MPLAPMLARLVRELPRDGYLYEPKWDGFRCLAEREGDAVDLRSRHGRPLARYFPELTAALARAGPPRWIADGEILRISSSRPSTSMPRRYPACPGKLRRMAADGEAVGRAADELYGLPLGEFTRARDERAKALRAGDREAANAVKALRKPTLAAWALNQLVRRRRKDVERLLAAGADLRAAQDELLGGGDRAAFQRAAAAERELVAELTAAAFALVAENGRPGPGLREKLAETLHAAALDEDTAAELDAGRLLREREAIGGFGMALPAASSPRPAATRSPRSRGAARPKRRTTGSEERRDEQLAAIREAEREARREAEAAARDLRHAEERAETARTRAEAAEAHAREVAERAAVAQERASDAAERAQEADSRLNEAGDAEKAARRAHEQARKRLEAAER